MSRNSKKSRCSEIPKTSASAMPLRIDPMLDGRPVTFTEMCDGHRSQELTSKQLHQYWEILHEVPEEQREANISMHAEAGIFEAEVSSNQSFVDRDAEFAASVALAEAHAGDGRALFNGDGSLKDLGDSEEFDAAVALAGVDPGGIDDSDYFDDFADLDPEPICIGCGQTVEGGGGVLCRICKPSNSGATGSAAGL